MKIPCRFRNGVSITAKSILRRHDFCLVHARVDNSPAILIASNASNSSRKTSCPPTTHSALLAMHGSFTSINILIRSPGIEMSKNLDGVRTPGCNATVRWARRCRRLHKKCRSVCDDGVLVRFACGMAMEDVNRCCRESKLINSPEELSTSKNNTFSTSSHMYCTDSGKLRSTTISLTS